MDSEAYVLWNYYFDKNKRKKKRIKITIEQIVKMARKRERSKKKYGTYILNIKNQVGGSRQKTFDKIFQLALERYQELLKEGQAPTLIPYRPIAPRTDISKREEEAETIGTTENMTQQTKMSLGKVKAWFPKNLQNLLRSSFEVEFDEHKRNAIIRQKAFVNDKPSWWDINNIIIQKHHGRRISEGKFPSWIIPLKKN